MGDPKDSVNEAIRAKYNQGKVDVEIPRDAFSRPKPTADENADSDMGASRGNAAKVREHQGREEFRQMLQSLRSRMS